MADSKLSAIATKITALLKSVRYYISDGSGANKYSDLEQLAVWVNGFRLARIATARTLTSTTAAQAIFDAANDTVTLPVGVYLVDGVISINTMSATSGNAQFQIKGAGTAVLADVLIDIVGIDGATATAAARSGSTMVTETSPASAVTAGTGTAMQMNINGTIEVTTAGTLIPSIALVTANAAIVAAGSYLRFSPVGPNNMQSSEDWA